MKITKLLVVAGLLAGTVSVSLAGPGPQYWTRTKPVTTTKEAEALKDGDCLAMVCPACKTVAVTEYRNSLPNGKGASRWVQVGTKHLCDHCGGEISVVKGKTTNSMQHNCSKCGEGAAFCCAGTPGSDTGSEHKH